MRKCLGQEASKMIAGYRNACPKWLCPLCVYSPSAQKEGGSQIITLIRNLVISSSAIVLSNKAVGRGMIMANSSY